MDRSLVGTRSDGADRADHPDPVVAADPHRGPDARVDHADQRHVVFEAQHVEGGGGRRVAGDDDHLHVVPLDQGGRDLASEVPHLVERAGAIRIPAGISDVDEVFIGEEVDQGAGDGQPAESTVEHADGPIVHGPIGCHLCL